VTTSLAVVEALSVRTDSPLDLLVGAGIGVLRSTDGGASFSGVSGGLLYAFELTRSPASPSVVYAIGYGPEYSDEPFKSTDGGSTWAPKLQGAPVENSGQIVEWESLAVTPSNPSVVYLAASLFVTSTSTRETHVYRSTDAGESWNEAGGLGDDIGVAAPDWTLKIAVDPGNASRLLLTGDYVIESLDAGATWHIFYPQPIYPSVGFAFQGSLLHYASDGGIYAAVSGTSATPRSHGLSTRQYEHLANDPVNRTRLIATSTRTGGDHRGDASSWADFLPASVSYCVVDPEVPSVAFVGAYDQEILRTSRADVDYSPYTSIGPSALGAFVTMDPADPVRLYAGTWQQGLWTSANGGTSWTQLPSSNTSVSVAPSDGCKLISANTYNTSRSVDCGATWQASSPASFPGVGIAAEPVFDPKDSSVAYLATNNPPARLYRSLDGGLTWAQRGAALTDLHLYVVRVDPTDSSVLYAGTERGVFRSSDQGLSWEPFGTGLPPVRVYDIQILEDASIMRIATFGRGAWELEIPPSSNQPPVATFTYPTTPTLSISRGTTVRFTGQVADPDPADSVTGALTITDGWQRLGVDGSILALHRFDANGEFLVSLSARDNHGARAASEVRVAVYEPVFPTGDANGDHVVGVSDVFALVSYLFAGGPAPKGRCDLNSDGVVDVSDVFILINYLFAGGPAPQ
jgi:hypothetical protein